jgi:hypothetical protein
MDKVVLVKKLIVSTAEMIARGERSLMTIYGMGGEGYLRWWRRCQLTEIAISVRRALRPDGERARGIKWGVAAKRLQATDPRMPIWCVPVIVIG